MQIEIKEGIVTNDGAEIGAIHGSTCYLKKAVGPTVKGAIKKTAGLDALAFVVGEAPSDTNSTPPESEQSNSDMSKEGVVAALSDDELAEEMKRRGLIQDAGTEQPRTPLDSYLHENYGGGVIPRPIASNVEPDKPARGIGAVARLHALADQGKIPQPPAKHPAMGDKTPEYVAWFKSYATPEEIDIRYPDNRIVPATAGEFEKAEAKRHAALPGEKKDTDKANDFTDK